MEVSSTENPLHKNGTELARGGGNTMAGAAVAGGEDLSRNDEGQSVGAEVEDEVDETNEDDGDGVEAGVICAEDDSTGDGEEGPQNDEGEGQGLPARHVIAGKNEDERSKDGADAHGDHATFSRFDEGGVDGVASVVRVYGRGSQDVPCGDCVVVLNNTVDSLGVLNPKFGKCAWVSHPETVKCKVEKPPCE